MALKVPVLVAIAVTVAVVVAVVTPWYGDSGSGIDRDTIAGGSCSGSTVEALVSGHPRDGKKVSVTRAGCLREWFS